MPRVEFEMTIPVFERATVVGCPRCIPEENLAMNVGGDGYENMNQNVAFLYSSRYFRVEEEVCIDFVLKSVNVRQQTDFSKSVRNFTPSFRTEA
jgi:hypothetical protein